jgi:hypothetical protein
MGAGARFGIAVAVLPEQILESFFSMGDMMDAISYTMLLETAHHQLCMILIIFDQ